MKMVVTYWRDQIQIKNVQLIDRLGSDPNILGTIHLTTSHFVFRADDGGKEIWVRFMHSLG